MRQIRIISIVRFLRTLLGELAAATLIALVVEAAGQDILSLTKMFILFILSSYLAIYFDEIIHYE
jgi:hypothetical protein